MTHRMATKVATLPKRGPYLPLTEFQGHQIVKTKRELIARVISDVTRSVCVTTQTFVGLRNINLIPFRGSGWKNTHILAFQLPLRTDSLTEDHPCCETFLHFGLQRSHLNTCYYHQDRH